MKMWFRDINSHFLRTPISMVLGSCNGLTLVFYEQNPCRDILFAVFNPLTRQYYYLPPAKTGPWSGFIPAAGIGFDESTNALKTVVSVILQKDDPHYVYVTRDQLCLCTFVHKSGMRSWRDIAQKPAYPISGEGVFARGRLHWLASLDAYCWPPNYDGRKRLRLFAQG